MTFTQGNPTIVHFAKGVMPGTYELVLESYDVLTLDRSTLFADTLSVTIGWEPQPKILPPIKCPISLDMISSLQALLNQNSIVIEN